MRPSNWIEFLSKARALGEKFEKYPENGGRSDVWGKELVELRLDLLFLITAPELRLKMVSDYEYRLMHAAEIVIESLEKTYSGILAIDFKKRNG